MTDDFSATDIVRARIEAGLAERAARRARMRQLRAELGRRRRLAKNRINTEKLRRN